MHKSTGNSADFKLAELSTASAGIAEARVHRRLKKEFSNYLKPYNLTAMEWFVIGFLHEHSSNGVQLSEIAKHLQTTLPYLTNMLNELEIKGMLVRIDHTGDGRAKIVRLLPVANQLYNSAEQDLRAKLRTLVYDQISIEDFTIYMRVMYQLAAPDEK
jgi:DNA-binding MarR family transcriptional regulator